MNVPFLDLSAGYRELKGDIDFAVGRVLSSGRYVGGEEVSSFEAEWANYCGARHCVGTGNGLDALILALRACNIGAGDGVIVPSNTYIATWLAVSAVGASIQPVDPDPGTYNITPEGIANAVTPNTRAVLPVHLYGQPVEVDRIAGLARQQGLALIEDAAQAHGAVCRGQRIGAHGDAVCWSFYPGKNLGAIGDAGAVTCNDPEMAERIRLMGNYGSARKYVNEERGVNSRLDPIQAAVLRVKLTHLDEWNRRRRSTAERYLGELAETDLGLPKAPEWAEPVWHQFVVMSLNREALLQKLDAEGIDTLIHYPIPPHQQPAYADHGFQADDFPVARQLAREVLSLPVGPHLAKGDASAVIRAIIEDDH